MWTCINGRIVPQTITTTHEIGTGVIIIDLLNDNPTSTWGSHFRLLTSIFTSQHPPNVSFGKKKNNSFKDVDSDIKYLLK